jgi:hypothetical protein
MGYLRPRIECFFINFLPACNPYENFHELPAIQSSARELWCSATQNVETYSYP